MVSAHLWVVLLDLVLTVLRLSIIDSTQGEVQACSDRVLITRNGLEGVNRRPLTL